MLGQNFLEATLCLLLFKMKDKTTIILRRSEKKFYIPEADYFG